MSNKDANHDLRPRVVFFGSTDFSLPALRALAAGPYQAVLAVSPPPAPAGRGRVSSPTPVAILARELELPLFESATVKTPEAIAVIEEARPDFLVVAAFGGFLPRRLLNLCLHPPLNIHPSLLPRHRGAAPINWSLIHGDERVGVSIIFLEEAMDAGPILSQTELSLSGGECAGALCDCLAEMGARDLLRVLAELREGRLSPQPQDHSRATINPLLCKCDGLIDWNLAAPQLSGRINGVDPWPGAQTCFKGRRVKLFGASSAENKEAASPGRILGLDEVGRLLVAAGQGAVAIAELQPEGKKRQPAADFFRGYRPLEFTSL